MTKELDTSLTFHNLGVSGFRGANAALRSVMSSVVVDFQNGNLVFNWKHGGESEVNCAWPIAH